METREVDQSVRNNPRKYGMYMLATILKSKRAENATIAIIETFYKVRSLKRELVELHQETDKEKQKTKMHQLAKCSAI